MTKFDKAYYDRFYESRRSRVHGPKEIGRTCTAVANIIEATHGPIETALEVGAGTGLWRDWFVARRPKTRYRSTDVSAYACERYGHERRDIANWRARGKFDLVVCQSALPYLGAADAAKAIGNLAAMTGVFLYFEATTASDIEGVADRDATDLTMHHRTGEWYRRKLKPTFRQVGFGLWVRRDAQVPFWELECGPDR